MLIMCLYSQFISKTTFNFTYLSPFCNIKKKNTSWKVYYVIKLIKRYTNLNKEVFCAWKYPKVNSTINNYYLKVYKDSNHFY